MPKKKKAHYQQKRWSLSNQQQGARQVRSNTNILSVTYQHDRLHLTGKRPQQRSHGPHTAYISPKSLLGEKNTKQCDTGTNACHHWLLPWIMSIYYHLRVAQINNSRYLYSATIEAPGRQPLAMLLYGVLWRSNRSSYCYLLHL